MSRRVKMRYFLSKIVKICAMSQKKWLQVRWELTPHFLPLWWLLNHLRCWKWNIFWGQRLQRLYHPWCCVAPKLCLLVISLDRWQGEQVKLLFNCRLHYFPVTFNFPQLLDIAVSLCRAPFFFEGQHLHDDLVSWSHFPLQLLLLHIFFKWNPRKAKQLWNCRESAVEGVLITYRNVHFLRYFVFVFLFVCNLISILSQVAANVPSYCLNFESSFETERARFLLCWLSDSGKREKTLGLSRGKLIELGTRWEPHMAKWLLYERNIEPWQ